MDRPRTRPRRRIPRARALQHCRDKNKASAACELYSVDNGDRLPQAGGGRVLRSVGDADTDPRRASSGPASGTCSRLARGGSRPVRTQFAANLVLEHQFNPVATVVYSDGSRTNVGDALFGLNAGAAFPLTPDGQFEVQALGGFLLGRVNAANGSASFWDFPVELTAQANIGDVRLGAGPSVHIAPMLRGSGFASATDVDFATTVGAAVTAEYRFGRQFGLRLHFNWLRLSANGTSIDASRLGGALGIYL